MSMSPWHKPTPEPKTSEPARVTIGLPGLSAQLPIGRGVWTWLRRPFHRTPIEKRFVFTGLRTHVSIPEDDNGQIQCYLTVVNMTEAAFRVERVEFARVTARDSELPGAIPQYPPRLIELAALSANELYFNVTLGAPAIRTLLRGVQRAQNAVSSPGTAIQIAGAVWLSRRRKTVRVEFGVR